LHHVADLLSALCYHPARQRPKLALPAGARDAHVHVLVNNVGGRRAGERKA